MFDFLNFLFDTSSFPARWFCGSGWLQYPFLGWAHVVSDSIIFLSYFGIAVSLFYYSRKRPDFGFQMVVHLFGAFILLCGVTHLLEVFLFWVPIYGISGVFKVLSAVISAITLVCVLKLLPEFIKLPGLKTVNQELRQRISEKKAVEDRLKKTISILDASRRDALAADTAKRMFTVNMSHEIRTPLTAVIGFTDIIEDENLDPSQAHALKAIRRNGEHLLQLVNNVLDMAKIDAGGFKVRPEKVCPVNLLQEIETSFRLKSLETGTRFSLIYDSTIPRSVTTDPLRVKQVLFNLLGNSFKFADSGEVALRISFSETENKLRLSVEDSGVGMSRQQVEALFTPFYQADMSNTRKFGGTGLGLVISKELAKLLNGDILVQSEVGVGSIFTLELPVTKDESRCLICPKTELASPENEVNATKPPKLSGTVLVVDDMPDNRDLLEFYLKLCGCQTETAANGREAVDLALKKSFDLILLDMQMPEMDGYDAVRLLRAQQVRKTPVIAVTASVLDGAEKRCLDVGCDAYLRKPFKKEKLFKMLSFFLDESFKKFIGNGTEPRTINFTNRQETKKKSRKTKQDPAAKEAKIRHNFIRRLDERRSSLLEAKEKQDWAEVQSLTHKLASAELFGQAEIGKLASSIEEMCLLGKTGNVESSVEQLADVMKSVFENSEGAG